MAARRGHTGARRRVQPRYVFEFIGWTDRLGALSDDGDIITPIIGKNKAGALSDSGELNVCIVGADTLGKLRDNGDVIQIIVGSDSTGAPTDSGDIVPPVIEGEDTTGALSDSGTVELSLIDGSNALGALVDSGTLSQSDLTQYSVYALNLLSGAAAEYTNFELELMQIGETMFAVGDGGLYTLGAENDNGTDIDATLQSGFTDFESDRLKRMDSARIAGTGAICLKVRAIAKSGILHEHLYEPEAMPSIKPNTRIAKIGKGLRFTYAGVELTNMDGGDFELDQLDLYPVVLDRRR